MSSTTPGDKVILDQMTLARKASGQVELHLWAQGKVIY
jgi:hypothetical protein